MLELTLRLVFSLAVVVGLLLLLAKFGARRFKGGAGGLVQVVQRQPLSRTASVAVVTVGSRVLVLGATEHQVNVLAELDPEELVAEEADRVEVAGPGRHVDTTRDGATTPGALTGPLTGSVLSPRTWKQALAAMSQPGPRDRS